MSVAAFLDASLLYPTTLRSVLVHLAAADVFQALCADSRRVTSWLATHAVDARG